jgi:hypothetical protein
MNFYKYITVDGLCFGGIDGFSSPSSGKDSKKLNMILMIK